MSLKGSSGYWDNSTQFQMKTELPPYIFHCISKDMYCLVVIQTCRFVVWWNDFDSWSEECLQKGANARNKVETSKKALVLQSLPYIVINAHDVA